MTDPYTDGARPELAGPVPPIVTSPMTLYRVDGRGRKGYGRTAAGFNATDPRSPAGVRGGNRNGQQGPTARTRGCCTGELRMRRDPNWPSTAV